MQWAFFRIPVTGDALAEELNRFLRSVRVLVVHREFVAQGDASFWALAVEYQASEAAVASHSSRRDSDRRVDYKSVLSADDFTLFARLREWRKEQANTDAVPVYTIFTNDQLAEIAKRRCSTVAALGEIDGVGQGRIEKYGQMVLAMLTGNNNGE